MTVSQLVAQQFRHRRRLALPGWFRLLGPAFVVSIGYMDPGNWATDLAAGAYGTRLLWTTLVASAIAIVLQLAVTRLTIASGESFTTRLARAPALVRTSAWIVLQTAAVATDLAEFTGIVLGIALLTDLSLLASILAGAVVVAALLLLARNGSKAIEYVLIAIVAAIAIAFFWQLPLAHVRAATLLHDALVPGLPDHAALLVAIGILGATVMPHNIVLHSALIDEGCATCSRAQRERRGRFFIVETLVALTVAAFVNGAILVVGSAVNGANGSIADAFAAIGRIGGAHISALFGAALLLSGLAATVTATLSGDVVFRSLAPVALAPGLRRAITLVPAAAALALGVAPAALLVWSQVALAFILPIVLVPLVAAMIEARLGRVLIGATALVSAVCLGADLAALVVR